MYNGVEIDMLSLGDADCILVSFWSGFSVHRVLIDGGNKGDAPIVRGFLRGLNIATIDDVLSTHLHDDHSGGLIDLLSDETLTFGKLWCHVPHWHVESKDMNKVWAALKAPAVQTKPRKLRNPWRPLRPFSTLPRSAALRTRTVQGKTHRKPGSGSPTEEF